MTGEIDMRDDSDWSPEGQSPTAQYKRPGTRLTISQQRMNERDRVNNET